MLKTLTIDLEYQSLIDGPPQAPDQLHEKACSADKVTVDKWREIWIQQTKENKVLFGSFAEKSIGKLHNINRYRPAIICGSGPSLKSSIEALKENRAMEQPLLTVSCLHNFGYFEDEGCHADYYITLDAGSIILDDVTEGRKEKPEFYWEKTEGKTLLASVTTPRALFEKWRGNIYLFATMMPSLELHNELQAIERFSHYVSAGGNALGGCLYVAQAIFGSSTIHIVGGDFCFDYDNTFHSYKTHYDALGGFVMWPDVYGMPRKTWPSYLNFKFWFDWVACRVPGRYVNCSEGLLGAYREGNIRQFQYMTLKEALLPYKLTERIFLQMQDDKGAVLDTQEVRLKELFLNPAFEKDITLF